MTAAGTPVAASESDLLMAEHPGRVVQDHAAASDANGDVWGMPGRVSPRIHCHISFNFSYPPPEPPPFYKLSHVALLLLSH